MKFLLSHPPFFNSLALGLILGFLTSCVTSEEVSKNIPTANASTGASKNGSDLGKEYKSCIKLAAQRTPLSQEVFQGCESLLPDSECRGVSCGELSKTEFSAVIAVFLGKIRACYDQELSTNKNAQGRIATSFSVNKEGKVENLVLERNDLSPQMGACLAATSQQWLFPQKSGRTESIKYPFLFDPK